jgi:hypothetical protein
MDSDDKKNILFRRLLLSKQLYSHGLEHSNKSGALNKMIAVHNFHNSIEVALRSIIIYYEIRPEKTLNIDFENMLNEVDNHLKAQNLKLPYRQDIRNLNQLRNLVQHHAVEPESSTMDEWRVFTKRFLEKICDEYFHLKFESLSSLDMIDDNSLKEILQLSLEKLHESKMAKSLELSKLAFHWASDAIWKLLPQKSFLDNVNVNIPSISSKDENLIEKILYKLETKFDEIEYYSALLSSGINIFDLKKFESITPLVGSMLINGLQSLGVNLL